MTRECERKQHSTEFKARVAMAALSGDKTLSELSSEFGVHPMMISTWKQELTKRASELFGRGSKPSPLGKETSMNSGIPEQNKQLVIQHFEDFVNRKDLDAIMRNMAEDFYDHDGPGGKPIDRAGDGRCRGTDRYH